MEDQFLRLHGCITIGEISGASIVENGNDGWNIDSIVTLVKDDDGGSPDTGS